MAEAHIPLLLFIVLVLFTAWMAYRAERDLAAREPANPPCGAEAFLSALSAATHRMNAAAQRLEAIAEQPHCADKIRKGEYVEFQRVQDRRQSRVKAGQDKPRNPAAKAKRK